MWKIYQCLYHLFDYNLHNLLGNTQQVRNICMYLERWRKWKLKAIWVERTRSLNYGFFFGSMWCWIWLKSCQVMIFNLIFSMQNKAHTSSMMFHNMKQWFLCPMYVRKNVFLYNMECVGKKEAHYFFLFDFSLPRFSHSLPSFKRPRFTIILCFSSGTPIIS